MTAFQQLRLYLVRLERRLRLLTVSRGTALIAAVSLLLTVVLVWIADRFKFTASVVLPFRVLLYFGLAVTITIALAIPLWQLTRRRVTLLAETRMPEFGQRLLTLTENPDENNPFTELVAEEALQVARAHGAEALAPSASLWTFLLVSATAATLLIWMITAAPGFWGYGASLLWTGNPHAGSRPLYEVTVRPGNKIIRRRANQVISAQLLGFASRNVVLHARYRGALKWDTVPMLPERNGNGYEVLFAGLSDSLEYYVQADDAKSTHFTLGVKDLPAVKRIRVTIRFPAGLGLRNVVDDPGGDIRAVIGSQAQVAVVTDRPLNHGVLVLDSGKEMPLLPTAGGWLEAHLPVLKDGSYHIASVEDKETVRLTDDYFIEAKKDELPTVRIVNPGRDPHVSPIEELGITAQATDDFGIQSLELHYSVNGAPEQVRSLKRGDLHSKELTGKTTLFLEDSKLAPGDLISMYATARDAGHMAKSDMVFAQADPFDFKFQQSQQAGGGGGGGQGGDQEAQISARQKELIAATWNQLKDGVKDKALLVENSHFLSDVEGKLGQQAKALAERMGSRDLAGTNPEFQRFSQSMAAASEDMSKAVDQLKPGKWTDALPPEQQALQSLLRAESIFRDIQVSYGKSGGGGGGSNGAERDLARMLDLELDTAKNQYESNKAASLPGSNEKQKQIEDAFQRLKDLARRQQELAEQQRSKQTLQQRWEEEQLRREAEQLRQQMQQLAKDKQSGGENSGSQSEGQAQNGQAQNDGSQNDKSRTEQSGDSSSSSARNERGKIGDRAQERSQNQSASADAQSMRRSMEALGRAEDEMRKSVSNGDASAQSRAAAQLAEAQSSLKNMLNNAAGEGVSGLTQKAQQLAHDQKDLAGRVKQLYGAGGINTARSNQTPGNDNSGKLEMPEMSGPGYAGGYSRRRYFQESGRNALPEEKALAAESDKLAQQVERLQREMQNQAQNLQAEQPDASRKMRQALSEAEQEELALRMQKNGEWLRKGFGAQTWPQEDSITAGLEQLSRQMEQTQQAMKNGNADVAGRQEEKIAEALSQVRSLREQLESRREQGGSKSNPGGTKGQAQASEHQAGTSSGQAAGGSAKSGSTSGQDEESGGAVGYAPFGRTGRPRIGGSSADEAISQLQGLRSDLGRADRKLDHYLNDAIGSLRQDRGQAGLLDARINEDAVTSLERLEIELTHRVGQSQSGARVGSPESAPDGYRDAVAEYFRKLSK